MDETRAPSREPVDVINQYTGEKWYYSDIVKDHFFNPRNLLLTDPGEGEFNASGIVGSPACGDVMHIWMKIDPGTERVKDLKWRTFGCGSAIAATSMFSVMVTEDGGRTLDESRNIKPQQIMERLGGLPNRKIHCSVLVDKAFHKAANDYFRKANKYDKIVVEGAKVIDAATQTTDKDIEEAVLEGAVDLDSVQKKLKVGIGNPGVVPEVEQLIRFYKEKYYG
ncbi:MAG: iron-sulfur cluster assembly scaffold protein [Candidatus Sungbacteria bacterium]|uniref:Iron-sulfur cluster assembly scaffold protein n=1 Tax=Candidatus Sungiibacteriota bacterium TaxID=2750080 RepID=A0A931WP20_9BACT|nr:iron-sulfur cluster assembly scaffold protein [Candidatus Sungbacteria bacterium]